MFIFLFGIVVYAENTEVNITVDTFQCSNGIDDNNNGYIDYPSDAGCSSSRDNDESSIRDVETHYFSSESKFNYTFRTQIGGELTIEIPAFAYSESTLIKMQLEGLLSANALGDKPVPSDKEIADPILNITLTETLTSSSITELDKPVIFTWHYNDGDITGIARETDLQIYRWDGSSWVALDNNEVDTDANTVSAETTHFSSFSLLGPAQEEEEEETDTTTTSTSGGGGGGGIFPSSFIDTEVRILGKAYPESEVSVLKDGVIKSTTTADKNANFLFEITDFTAGVYTFGVWAKDNDGHHGKTYNFTIYVAENTITTIDRIFLSPTIITNKEVVKWGNEIDFFGQTTSEGIVNLRINSEEEITEEIKTEEDGVWRYRFDSSLVSKGIHEAQAQAMLPNSDLTSSFSQSVEFAVGKGYESLVGCRQSDINQNNQVALADFSILLFNWGSGFVDARADINNDGVVDIRDFSILLYCWTG